MVAPSIGDVSASGSGLEKVVVREPASFVITIKNNEGGNFLEPGLLLQILYGNVFSSCFIKV